MSALRSGAATSEGRPLQQIDTHVSYPFLADARAYKLKRAVRLPFVAFTTPDARRAACEAELAANAACALRLYEGVQPVVRRSDGRIAVGGAGAILD